MAMIGGQGPSYTTPKTRIGQLVNGWIEWSESAELQSQNASAAYSFVSRARSLSSSHPGSPDGDHGVDLQGPDTEAASMPTPANRARVGSEAPPALFSSVPVQDMEFTRERSASIHSSVSTNPSIVPDPDYHDDPSPAKKTFGILKERNVSLSGAPILPAQPETTPPRYPKTRTHTEMVEKELTFSERSLASLLAGSGRLVSGPAQSYFAMMRCATHDNVPRNASGFDNQPPPAASVDVDRESAGAPDDETLSTSEDD